MSLKKATTIRDQIDSLAEKYEHTNPKELLQWGIDNYEQEIILACSFGPEDLVLLDMLATITTQPKVFYLDTDLHFKETYETRDRLAEKYNMSFIQIRPELNLDEQARQYGDKLWKSNPDHCCYLRKVKPLTKVLSQHEAWITGIRREQAPTRANARKVEWDAKFNLLKLNPLANWTHQDVWNYIREHDIPYNPLHDQNYPSIGCEVCTHPVEPGQDPRSGRWGGMEKTECGLHK